MESQKLKQEVQLRDHIIDEMRLQYDALSLKYKQYEDFYSS